MGSQAFTVIVGDLIHSRDIAYREQLSHKIRSAIAYISREFREEFYAPIVLTRGIDELSGVLEKPDMSYKICRLLNDRIYPREFRFAIVRSTLDVAISSKNAAMMDGPAFHTAADLIQQAKNKNLYYRFNLFEFEEFDPWLSELTNLLHILRRGWSKQKHRVVQLYEEFGNQETVAKKLGITQQAVSDALQKAYWKELKRAENMVDVFLEKHDYYK
jgi:hypothetical protein